MAADISGLVSHVGTAGPGPRCSDSQHLGCVALYVASVTHVATRPVCPHGDAGCTFREAACTSLALRSWLIAVWSLSPNACHALWEQAALETA